MVGDGEIGITKSFGDLVPASTAGPRASRQVPKSAVKLDSAPTGAWPAYSSHLLPAPCRQCGGPSWLTDDLGAVHPCCELMWTEKAGCLACRTSDVLNRQHRERDRKKLTRGINVASV